MGSNDPNIRISDIFSCFVVYRLKEARQRNIEQLRTLHSKPGTLPPRDDDDDDDSGISSHGNGTGSISSPEFSKSDPLTLLLSSASLKNPSYIKARILWEFKSTRLGTELSVSKGEIVHMLYREGDQVLVVNSSSKRGFIPLRCCTLLQKKQTLYCENPTNHRECYDDSNLQNKFQNSLISTSRSHQHYHDCSLQKETQSLSISDLRTHLAKKKHCKSYREMNLFQSSTNTSYGNQTSSKISHYKTELTNASSSSEDSDNSFRGRKISKFSEVSPKWGSRNGLDANKNYTKDSYMKNSRYCRVTENSGKNSYVMDHGNCCLTDNAQACYVLKNPKNGYVHPSENVKESYEMDVKSRYVSDKFRQRQKHDTSFFRKCEDTKMMVLYDFIARDENDISVYKGENILVLNRDDNDWWWIATPEGYEGFVPSRYLSTATIASSDGSTNTACSSIESSSSTSEGSASSTQAVRFQEPLCTFHRYEKEEWETESEISRDGGYPVDDKDEEDAGPTNHEKSRWSTWC